MNELERQCVENRALQKKIAREGDRLRELKSAVQVLFQRQLSRRRKRK